MSRSLALLAAGLLVALLASDPELGHRNQPLYQAFGWRIDSLGFCGPEVSEAKPPGTLRRVASERGAPSSIWRRSWRDLPYPPPCAR